MTIPISGLICGDCARVIPASGEHFLNECPEPSVHPGLVEAVLAGESHLDLVLTPTTVLGAVRAEVIKRCLPYFPDARGFNAPAIGTAVGAMVEIGMTGRGQMCSECRGSGTVDGEEVHEELVIPTRQDCGRCGGAGKEWVGGRSGWRRQVRFTGRLWGEEFRTDADLFLSMEGECPACSGIGSVVAEDLNLDPDAIPVEAVCGACDGTGKGSHGLHWISDNKFKGEGSYFYQQGRGGLASEEDSAQLSMVAELAEQSGNVGAVEADLTVWYGCNLPAEKASVYCRKCKALVAGREASKALPQKPWMRARARKMTLDEIGAMRAFGAQNTVLEAVRIHSAAFKALREGADPHDVVAGIPLACETRFNPSPRDPYKACRLFCGVAHTCLLEAGLSRRERGMLEIPIPGYEGREVGR